MFAQFIFSNLLQAKSKYAIKYFAFLRLVYLKFSDPIVVWNYHGQEVAMNLSHDLPFNIKQYPTYSQNLGDVAAIIAKKYTEFSVIDVGANVGDSAAIVQHQVKVPVLCIEGNPKFLPLLKQNSQKLFKISIEACFVGEKVSKAKPINQLGTAYLEENESGFAVETISSVIEKHPAFSNAKLIKIDTDGFDNKIIRGAAKFLKESKASIFFEYDPFYLAKQQEKGTDIFDFLVDLGYKKWVVFDNFGRYMLTLNETEKHVFENLHQYFNQNGNVYMDLWVIHEQDAMLDFKA